jgi:hypothetical protein
MRPGKNRKAVCMRRYPASLVAAASLLPAVVLGTDPSVLRVSSATGEPGEEVALEFRADLSMELRTIYVHFEAGTSLDFLRIDVRNTASAHVMPRGIVYNPRFFRGGYLGGVRFDMQGQRSSIEEGADLLLFRAVLRIRHDAPPGDQTVRVLAVDAFQSRFDDDPVSAPGDASVGILPPSRPRPVGLLNCTTSAGGVALSWALAEEYDVIRLLRDGPSPRRPRGVGADACRPGRARTEALRGHGREGRNGVPGQRLRGPRRGAAARAHLRLRLLACRGRSPTRLDER